MARRFFFLPFVLLTGPPSILPSPSIFLGPESRAPGTPQFRHHHQFPSPTFAAVAVPATVSDRPQVCLVCLPTSQLAGHFQLGREASKRMADVTGLALAVVSLFDTCVTSCRLISTVSQFPEDMRYLHASISWEEYRLRTWARIWGIDAPNDRRIITTPRTVTQGVDSRAALLVAEARTAFLDLELLQGLLSNAVSLLERGKGLLAIYYKLTQEDAVCLSSRGGLRYKVLININLTGP